MKTAVAIIIILVIAGVAFWMNYDKSETVQSPSTSSQPAESTSQVKELQITDITIGTGAEAKDGDIVKVHYTGTFENGEKFDSSLDRGEPIEFQLGSGMVIKGWDMGIKGMKIGGKRKLIIPGDLAYGQEGRPGKIPPNATLLFDVELMEVKTK